jgi:magnesium transporter
LTANERKDAKMMDQFKKNIKSEFLKSLRLLTNLNRKKDDPDKYIFTGYQKTDETDIQLFQYNKDEYTESKSILPESVKTFEKNGDNYWLNINGLNETEIIASICQKQGIHGLVIQDILDVNQRPKFQEYDNYSFLTLKSIIHSGDQLISEQISFVFSANYLISFQERKSDFFEHLITRIRENKGIVRERGADYLLYAMLESILDNYFMTLKKLDDEIEMFKFTDAKKELSPNTLEIIEYYKKIVHFVKKSIFPIKEFTLILERGECQFIEQRHKKYFYEIKDLCLTLIDSADMILSSLESSTNLFFSMQGHRMNQVIKTLTIVATIFIPMTFVAGIYGMNFRNMPELAWKYGYIGIWIMFILIFGGMVMYFKKKKWF